MRLYYINGQRVTAEEFAAYVVWAIQEYGSIVRAES